MASTVLVVTALEDVTADAVVAALNERGVPVVRVDPADIGPALTFGFRVDADRPAWGGRLRTASREVESGEVAAVYYRRPTPYGTRFAHLPRQQRDFAATEARHGLGGVLNALPGARYVNHPAAVARAESKPAQLRRFARLGLRIPPTLITNDPEAAREFAAERGPVVCKTFRGLPAGDDGRTGAIWTQRVDPETFDDTLTVTAHLFQAEIPKTGDVRVTVVGRRVFAQQIAAPDGALDWRRGDWGALLHAPITVPPPVVAALHSYLASFGLAFGCFDFALTGDGDDPEHWTAIECNPNGQWGWLPDAEDITEAFADLLTVERKGRS
ncbi:ATP-grasp ribosomal peptide maturase [Streptomyces sp. NPDC006967]|uniref:ATP-grasp ribosomal peptide maturase n=1 Tax=unclassified Streptomyces TaxID=2593676 RepID=UPI000CD5C36F|nr:ATP-grasp ribosomal peptide maturase [Streptomyces sp. SM1]